jgi:hypothetical protein
VAGIDRYLIVINTALPVIAAEDSLMQSGLRRTHSCVSNTIRENSPDPRVLPLSNEPERLLLIELTALQKASGPALPPSKTPGALALPERSVPMQSRRLSASKLSPAEYDAHIKALVDDAPPLTDEQRAQLRQLLAPSDAAAAMSRARWAKVTDRTAATQKARDTYKAQRLAAKAAEDARDSRGVGDAA